MVDDVRSELIYLARITEMPGSERHRFLSFCSFVFFLYLPLLFFCYFLSFWISYSSPQEQCYLLFVNHMEYLYTDSKGVVPSSGREFMVAGEWIALNASAGKIPSTKVFQQALEDRAFLSQEAAARSPGWTWTKQPTWYADRYHWDAWMVIDYFPDEGNSTPWYFSEGGVPRTCGDGKFYFDTDIRREAEDCLSKLWLCVDSIVSNPPFVPGTEHPTKFNYLRLSSGWDSAQAADAVGGDAKARAKEYLGFLNWWSSSVTDWDAPLEGWMVDYINSFQLRSLRKRGVLVDVLQHFRTLNVGHLLAENVPLYYFWMNDMGNHPRFTRLSPTILQAYHDACEALDKAEVFGADMIGFQDEIDVIKTYDNFFQLRYDPYNMSSPCFTDIPSSAKVYICDFEGWRGRLLIEEDTIRDYAERYHFTIDEGTPGTPVTMWRWQPRLTGANCEQRAGQEGTGSSREAQHGDREIREIYKGVYGPPPGKYFDELGQMSFLARLGDKRFTSSDEDATPTVDGLQDPLPRPHWAPASYPQLFVPRSSSPLASESKWVQSMAAVVSDSLSRESSVHGRASRDRQGRDLLGRRRSASPIRSSSRSSVSLPLQRARFVDELRVLGQEFEVVSAPWTSKKPLSWNDDFLEVGYLLFGDEGAQARLRYWASCSPDCSSLATLLYKGIRWGIPFKIGVKVEDFPRFRPENISDTDRLVGKPSSAVEPPFLYTAQGALKAYYMSRVNDIIRRPHARILIGMGGPEAWLGRKWGGSELVAQFMEGPSPDVFLYRRGNIDSDDEHPMFLYTDEMTPQEIDILFGCIRSDGDKDKSLYPSRDVLDEGCFFWTGEWDSKMEDMFTDLTKDILQGTAKFKTPGMWNEYFRRRNRGSRGPKERLNQVVPASLRRLHARLLDGFPVDWHKRCITNIELPEEYCPR